MDRPARLRPSVVHPLPALAPDQEDVDPAGVGLGQFKWLDRVVDGADVVAVGESSHFNAESHRLRHLVLRYLVERHGFTTYALESGFAEGWQVDSWLDRPAGDPTDVGPVLAHGMTSLMGMAAAQRQLLEWLRATAENGLRVRFRGVDVPGSGVSLLPALDLVAAYLADHDPDLRVGDDLRALAAVGAATSIFQAQRTTPAYADLPTDRKDALTAGLSILLGRLRARRPWQVDADGSSAGTEFDRAVRALETAIALDQYRRSMRANVRDLAQADTVEWLLARGERVVLAAHNAHVQRWPTEFPGVLPASTTLGQHLAQRIGRRYRVIGVTNGVGQTLTSGRAFLAGDFFEPLPPPPDGTLDAVLHAAHDAPFGVDLTALGADDRAVLAAVGEQRSGAFRCPIGVLAAYDALVHLPHVTPARLDPAAVAAASPEVAAVFRRWIASGGPG